jgi:hypothetical protein
MGIGVAKYGDAAASFGRRLACIAVASALIIQAVFIGLAGAQLSASFVGNGPPGFELCLNGAHNRPTDAPRHDGNNHCALCFVGTYQPLAAPPKSPSQPIGIGSGLVWWLAAGWPPPRSREYTIARPRGPPLSA